VARRQCGLEVNYFGTLFDIDHQCNMETDRRADRIMTEYTALHNSMAVVMHDDTDN